MKTTELLRSLYDAALEAVSPYETVLEHMDYVQQLYVEGDYRRLVAAAFGKSAYAMIRGVEETLSDLLYDGVAITKYGHTSPAPLKHVRVFEAGHPTPDENGLMATRHLLNLAHALDERTMLLCLISGGGSSLFVCPRPNISLKDKQMVTDLLLKAGANINELNAVRKHLSLVKGGQFARMCHPAKVVSLIVSDCVGDPHDVIASGPTTADSTTFSDAFDVLIRYDLTQHLHANVVQTLIDGQNGLCPETPKNNDAIFNDIENIIVANNRKALDAVYKKVTQMGIDAHILTDSLSGEARGAAKWLAQKVKELRITGRHPATPLCLISGGETTVTVKGHGAGGRNMELALAFAIEIEGLDGVTLLSAGTDGTDNVSDAAGAVVNGYTTLKAKELGLPPQRFLDNNDSYNFFKQLGDLFTPGPTQVNVMDIQLIILQMPHSGTQEKHDE
ncbi:MAG: glycerate kinase [Nitrospirae bacterium]|nr:glycerate kinase [Nitrospirota bacterium]